MYNGVGLRYLIVSVPVMAPTPDVMLATPSSSSKSAAITPPCTQPGGPSYADVIVARPRTSRPSTSSFTGGASGLYKPIIGENGK